MSDNNQVGGRHYQGSGLQPFDVIDAWGLDFYLGSALKYIMRAGKKEGVRASEDLRKSEHYLSEAAERAEASEELKEDASMFAPIDIRADVKNDQVILYEKLKSAVNAVDGSPWPGGIPHVDECWYINNHASRQLVRIKQVDRYADGSPGGKVEYVIKYHFVGLDGVAIDEYNVHVVYFTDWLQLAPEPPSYPVPNE